MGSTETVLEMPASFKLNIREVQNKSESIAATGVWPFDFVKGFMSEKPLARPIRRPDSK